MKKRINKIALLESSVDKCWWKHLFDESYLITDQHTLTPERTKNEIDQFIELLKPSKDAHILDLCCGFGRHLHELNARGYQYLTGIDYSKVLLNIAREKDKHDKIKWIEGDIRDTRKLTKRQFDYITCFGNSFGYFDSLDEDVYLLKNLKKSLKDDGKIILDICDGDWLLENLISNQWNLVDENKVACYERKISEENDRVTVKEILIDIDNFKIKVNNYAIRVFNKAKLKELIKKAGFDCFKIYVGEGLKNHASGKLDHGMMKNRLWVIIDSESDNEKI